MVDCPPADTGDWLEEAHGEWVALTKMSTQKSSAPLIGNGLTLPMLWALGLV